MLGKEIEFNFSRTAYRRGEKVLVYGLGNVGRQDDGLGVRLVEALESAGLGNKFHFECNYQLNIEDALILSEHDLVIFADASKLASTTEPFTLQSLQPGPAVEFTTHSMRPQGVLSLCKQLYGRMPRAFLLALPGYEWEIADTLSDKAALNLQVAVEIIVEEMRRLCA